MSEMYAGTPLPVNKLSLEMQTQFLSDLQQIPVYGEFIHSFVGSCDGEFLVVRAYPLQLRMTLVTHQTDDVAHGNAAENICRLMFVWCFLPGHVSSSCR